MKRLLIALIATMLLTSASEALVPSWNKGCVRIHKVYQSKPGHKAFAMTPQSAPWSICSAVYGASSRQIAEQRAVQDYNKRGSTSCYIMYSE